MSTVFDNAGATRASERRTGCWTREYALRHCEGYMVDGPRGHVGFVSAVVEIDGTLELVIEGAAGERFVPSDAIESFDPRAERIVIALALP